MCLAKTVKKRGLYQLSDWPHELWILELPDKPAKVEIGKIQYISIWHLK